MTPIQKQNQNKFQIGYKKGGLLVLIIAVAVTAFILSKKQGKTVANITRPETAQASEMPGWWYKDYFGTSVCQDDNCKPESDPDNDKLTNAQEFYYHSDPQNFDTNGNGQSDGEDVAQGFDPSKEGKLTFDQAASDDNIFGESLLFNTDVKQILNELVDPNKVQLDLPSDSEINISSDNSPDAITNYLTASDEIAQKYLPKDIDAYITDAANSNSEQKISDVNLRIQKILLEFNKLSVPSELLTLHKYEAAYMALIPQVIDMPSEQELSDMTNAEANTWYDKTQAFFTLSQKINLETEALKRKYQ